MRLVGESWNVAESEKVFACVLATYLERTVYCGESDVVKNNAIILHSAMITARQNEILPSGRNTLFLTEEKSWLMTQVILEEQMPRGKRSCQPTTLY